MELAQQVQYSGTRRRKDATARVRLVPGSGKITMNGKAIEDYIPFANLRAIVNQPFAVTKTEGQYDVLANVNGSDSLVKQVQYVTVSPVHFSLLIQTSVTL